MSTLVGSVSKRNTLVRNIVNMVNKYKLDGVNIDWGKSIAPYLHKCIFLL